MTITRGDAFRIGVASEVVDQTVKRAPLLAGLFAAGALAWKIVWLIGARWWITAPVGIGLALRIDGWSWWAATIAVTAPFAAPVCWWVRRERRSAADGGSEAPPSLTDLSITARREWRILRWWPHISISCRLLGVKSGMPMPLFDLRGTPTGVTARIRVHDGLEGHQFEDAAGRMAQDLRGCRLVEVAETTPQDGHPDLVRIAFTFGDELVVPFDYSEVRSAGAGKVAFGRYSDGKPATVDIGTSVLIGGVTGSGKSSAIWAILGGLLDGQVPTRVWVLDPKGGVEFSKLRQRVGKNDGPLQVVDYAKAANPAESEVFVKRFYEAMKVRLAQVGEDDQRKFRPSEAQPLNVLLIDELLSLQQILKKGTASELALVLTQGRAAGFIVIAATQASQIDAIGRVRDLFNQRLCFATRSPEVTYALLGQRVPAHKIAVPDQAGVGYAYSEVDASIRRFRAGYVDDTEAGRIARGEPSGDETALYRWFDADDRLIYVGISNDPARRTGEHVASKKWKRQMKRQTIEWFTTRAEALEAESAAIRTENPVHNIAGAGSSVRARGKGSK